MTISQAVFFNCSKLFGYLLKKFYMKLNITFKLSGKMGIALNNKLCRMEVTLP